MKKFIALLLAAMLFTVAFASCKKPKDPDSSTGGSNSGSSEAQLAEFEGITFDGATYTYDGAAHTITVKGNLPAGTDVSYENNSGTDVGDYNAKATLSCSGYKTKTLSAKLIINKAPITAEIKFDGMTVEYDGLPHSLAVEGNLPKGVTVSYTYNGEAVSGVTDAGDYTVKATISGKNYVTKELTATLSIVSSLGELYGAVLGGTVYFQNPLDDNKLYKYSGGTLSKVNNDEARYFTEAGGKLYYSSKGLLKSMIRSISSDGRVADVTSSAGEYLVSDGNYIYYAVNNLIFSTDDNGIYRVPVSGGDEAEILKLYSGKASWLCLNSGKVYFAAGDGKGVIKSVPTSGGSAQTLTDYDVSDMIIEGTTLYFNRYENGAAAITRMSVSGGSYTKMTTDKGKNLTVVGNSLYYVNSDMLTTLLFGEGISRVGLTASGSLPGASVIEGRVCSLMSDGNYLYYYVENNKHLYRASINGGAGQDLMAGFVPKDDTVVMGYAHIEEKNGEIYYINPRDNGAIYKYVPETGLKVKVIPDGCSTFLIGDEYIYYSTNILENYALWRIPVQGGEAQKLSSDRCDNLKIIGDYIYYVNNGLTSNRLCRMKKDGTGAEEQVVGANVHFVSYEIWNNAVYYCTNPAIGYKKFCRYDIATGTEERIENGEKFVSHEGTIFFYDQQDKKLKKYTVSTKAVEDIISNVNIEEMIVADGYLYYTDEKSGQEGLYRMPVGGNKAERIVEGDVAGIAATSHGIAYIDMKVSYTGELESPMPGINASDKGGLCIYKDGKITTVR